MRVPHPVSLAALCLIVVSLTLLFHGESTVSTGVGVFAAIASGFFAGLRRSMGGSR